MGSFMHIACKRVSQMTIFKPHLLSYIKSDQGRQDFDLGYMKLILCLLSRNAFLQAWLSSDSLYQDLELLYFLHLPTQQEWSELVPVLYHELIPGFQD